MPLNILLHLSVHLVLPIAINQSCPALYSPKSHCISTASTTSSTILETLPQYPANIARNIGRYFTNSKYIIIADLDHYFSKNFEVTVRKLAEDVIKKSPKTLLVYRIFEVSTRIKQ